MYWDDAVLSAFLVLEFDLYGPCSSEEVPVVTSLVDNV